MRTTMKLVLITLAFSGSAQAEETKIIGENALARALQEPLSNILTLVPNTRNAPCNGVVDCRKQGHELQTAWQVNNTSDFSPKDYPANCYVSGENGKYIYSASACR